MVFIVFSSLLGGPDRRLADDGKRFRSDGHCMGQPEALLFNYRGEFEGGMARGRTWAGGWRMTGSAFQALGVELTCESYCKGRGVWGEGGGPWRRIGGLADDGKRSSGAGS